MTTQRNLVAAETLRSYGITTLLFDFSGHGNSEGAVGDRTPAQRTDDLASVVDFLRTSELTGAGPIGILGGSSSALAALAVTADRPDIRALVLKAGRVDGTEEVATRVAVPTMLVVGERDNRILVENQRLLSRLSGPRRLAVIAEGDHLLEGAEVLRLTSACIAAWFARHLRGPVAVHHRFPDTWLDDEVEKVA
jgi:pimeloyl-ACP methyl ester carboxylesterase